MLKGGLQKAAAKDDKWLKTGASINYKKMNNVTCQI